MRYATLELLFSKISLPLLGLVGIRADMPDRDLASLMDPRSFQSVPRAAANPEVALLPRFGALLVTRLVNRLRQPLNGTY